MVNSANYRKTNSLMAKSTADKNGDAGEQASNRLIERRLWIDRRSLTEGAAHPIGCSRQMEFVETGLGRPSGNSPHYAPSAGGWGRCRTPDADE
ncbi:hypothetical protein Brsp05_03528 [Brucella sp. NBRC 12953]